MPLSAHHPGPLSVLNDYGQGKLLGAGNNETTRNQQQLRKEKMKTLLSVGNMRKTLSNNRKVLTSQNYNYRTTMTGEGRARTA